MTRPRRRVDTLVAGAHRNLNISKNWKALGLFSPAFDGEAGMLFRNSFPEGVPTWQQNQGPNRDNRIFGPLPWDDGKNYYCMSSFTRDQYTGCVLGLLMTFDLVGPDDASLRAEVGADLMMMADYLVRHEWSVVRPENTPQDPTPMVQPLGNGVSWVLFMTEAARHAAWVAGGLTDPAKFEAVTYALTGESQRLNLAVQHLDDWLRYYARWTQPTDLSAHCGVDFECIP